MLRTRHPSIARSALRLLADDKVGEDLEEIFLDVVRGTGKPSRKPRRRSKPAQQRYGATMNIGRQLLTALVELGVARPRAFEIAREVADEVVRVCPFNLLLVTTQAKTYRDSDQVEDAATILRKALLRANRYEALGKDGRSALYELGVAEGGAGRHVESLWLSGMSVSDARELGQLTEDNAKNALSGMGRACMTIDDAELAEIGRKLGLGDATFEKLGRLLLGS